MSQMPDVNDPEFRNIMYNMLLERIEHLNKADALVKLLLDERSPGALSRAPELWEQVRQAAKSQELINKYCRDLMGAAGDLMTDEKAYAAIGEFTFGVLKDQRGESTG